MTAPLDLAALRGLVDGRAVEALSSYEQADATGTMVLVSREAIDAVLPALNALPALLQVVSAACAFDDAWFVASVKDCGTDTPVERGAWALANAQARALADAVKEYRVTIDRARGEGR